MRSTMRSAATGKVVTMTIKDYHNTPGTVAYYGTHQIISTKKVGKYYSVVTKSRNQHSIKLGEEVEVHTGKQAQCRRLYRIMKSSYSSEKHKEVARILLMARALRGQDRAWINTASEMIKAMLRQDMRKIAMKEAV